MTLSRDPPFIVYGLPRSRTAWIAAFLTYRDGTCHHAVAITMRSVADVASFFQRPRTGAAETAAAPGARMLRYLVPGLREVVVRRPVADVVDAMLRVDVSGVATYDRAKLVRNMEYNSRALDRVARHKGVLVLDYADLDMEDACSAIFKHCLPYSFDREWWKRLRPQNIQADTKEVLRYYFANREAVERFKVACKSEIRRLAYAGLISNREA